MSFSAEHSPSHRIAQGQIEKPVHPAWLDALRIGACIGVVKELAGIGEESGHPGKGQAADAKDMGVGNLLSGQVYDPGKGDTQSQNLLPVRTAGVQKCFQLPGYVLVICFETVGQIPASSVRFPISGRVGQENPLVLQNLPLSGQCLQTPQNS